MPAPLRLIPAALCCVLVVAGCGGVPRNPTEPTFPNRGTPQTGQPGGDTGGGPVSPDQDPGLAGATSPQDFRMRAHAALLQGNLITGANGYTKYVELENTNPEAAFGLAVTTLLRDLDLFAGFTANELPLTFFNTPLAVSPTLVPQPLAAEDSYFWRLLALGVDSQPPLNPAKEVADFLAEAGGTPPPAPQPAQAQPGTPAQPVPGPRLSPGAIRPGGERPKEGSPSSPSRGKSGGGDAKGGSASASVAAPRGGQAATGITLPGTNRAIPALPAQRSLEPVAERSGQQEAVVAAGDEKGEDTTAGREQRTGGTQPGAQSVPGSTPPGNDPAQILANAEYQKLSSDLFASELVPAAQRYLGQRAGLWFSWRGRNERVNRLRATLDTLITAMDRSGEEVEDGFQVTLPLQLGAQKKAYEVTFQQEDYALLLQHLKLYKWLIDYRGMYTTAGNWNFLVPLKDTDSDGVLSPAEYYPAAPFGTLTEAAKQENLAPLRGSLGTILRDLGEAQKAYKDSDRYRTTEKNFIVPRNVDNNLDRLMLDENNRVLGVSLALPEDDGKVNLDYGNPSTEVAVNYGPLFDGTLDDVRSILPPVSADTHVVQPAPAGPEGEGAAARVLPASLSWEALLTRSVDVQGLILKGGTPANKATVKVGTKEAETGEGTGIFSIPDVQLNPLVGQTLVVSGGPVASPVELTVRSSTVVWDTSLPLQHAAGGADAPAGGATTVAPGGQTETGSPSGRTMMDAVGGKDGTDDGAESAGSHESGEESKEEEGAAEGGTEGEAEGEGDGAESGDEEEEESAPDEEAESPEEQEGAEGEPPAEEAPGVED